MGTNICKKTLKFYHLLYLHPPRLFQLSLTAGDHSGPRIHSCADVPQRSPPTGAAPHRRAAPSPPLATPRPRCELRPCLDHTMRPPPSRLALPCCHSPVAVAGRACARASRRIPSAPLPRVKASGRLAGLDSARVRGGGGQGRSGGGLAVGAQPRGGTRDVCPRHATHECATRGPSPDRRRRAANGGAARQGGEEACAWRDSGGGEAHRSSRCTDGVGPLLRRSAGSRRSGGSGELGAACREGHEL